MLSNCNVSVKKNTGHNIFKFPYSPGLHSWEQLFAHWSPKCPGNAAREQHLKHWPHMHSAQVHMLVSVCARFERERERERETWGQWPTLGRVTKSSTVSKFIKPLPSSMGSHGSLSPHTIKTAHFKKNKKQKKNMKHNLTSPYVSTSQETTVDKRGFSLWDWPSPEAVTPQEGDPLSNK